MNINERIDKIMEDVAEIKKGVKYNTKMIEDFTNSLKPSQDNGLSNLMNTFQDIIGKHPVIKENPGIKDVMEQMTKAANGGKS